MKPNNFALVAFALFLGVIILALPSCEHNTVEPTDPEPQNSFLPLAVGNWWDYEVTDAPYIDSTSIHFYDFTMSIVGKKKMDGKNYFLLHQYSEPFLEFPDMLMIRSDSNKILVHIEGKDRILYDFGAKVDSVWQIPYLLRPGDFPPDWKNCIQLTRAFNDTLAFHWNLCDATEEFAWDEVFEKGIGRVKLFETSQGAGEVTWELTDSNLKVRADKEK